MTYNRARFIILENKAPIRDSDAARALYDEIFNEIGGVYGGYISHHYDLGPRPAHFYMFDDPSPAFLAELLRIIRSGKVRGILRRDRWAEGEIEYNLEQIMVDISTAIQDSLLLSQQDSTKFAACWEGIKVLESMALLDEVDVRMQA